MGAAEFLCSWEGGVLTFEPRHKLYDNQTIWYEEGSAELEQLKKACTVSKDFSFLDMPSKVASEDWLNPVANPGWIDGLPEEGDVNQVRDPALFCHIKIGDAEFEEVNGVKQMKLHIEYTNTSDQDACFYEAMQFNGTLAMLELPHIWVIQDGVGLERVETDTMKSEYREMIPPNEVREYTLVYNVRTDSPIEVEINEAEDGGWVFGKKDAGKLFQP